MTEEPITELAQKLTEDITITCVKSGGDYSDVLTALSIALANMIANFSDSPDEARAQLKVSCADLGEDVAELMKVKIKVTDGTMLQ